MRVILTRPAREAGHWLALLEVHGFQVVALPLIAIAPAPDPAPLQAAWQGLPDFKALMFVSSNAVEQFFEQKVPLDRTPWAQPAIKTRAWAPGPATGDALAAAGVDPALIDAPAADAAQFDSEALWLRVAQQVTPGDRVLIVRGSDGDGRASDAGQGRDWLAAQLAAAGVQVETVVAYLRQIPLWDAQQTAAASRAADDGSVWLFSSSQAIANLGRLLPGQSWSQARALVTHPRIAQAAKEAGFGVVQESRPALGAIAAALESFG